MDLSTLQVILLTCILLAGGLALWATRVAYCWPNAVIEFRPRWPFVSLDRGEQAHRGFFRR